MNVELKPSTIKEIVRVIEKVTELLKSESNMEAVWALEQMHADRVLLDAARNIRISLDDN